MLRRGLRRALPAAHVRAPAGARHVAQPSMVQPMAARAPLLSSMMASTPVCTRRFATTAAEDSKTVPEEVLRCVVKVYSAVSAPNHLVPWQRKLLSNSTGSGYVVDRKWRLLLTNVHVVASASFIEVRKHGDAARYVAHVVYMGAACDLALLYVPDPAFWTDDVTVAVFEGTEDSAPGADASITALGTIGTFDGIPALQRGVKVVGFPVGGDQISITSGVVSRVDTSAYLSGGDLMHLLTIQLDAAINPGNSGGPAVCGGTIVGTAFQSLVAGDNIGYIVPTPVAAVFVRAFLKSAARGIVEREEHARLPVAPEAGYHEGFPMLGVVFQPMFNTTLRRSRKLPDDVSGVMVVKISDLSGAVGYLERNDVITKINGFVIANDGTVEWRKRERVRFSHVLQMTLSGDTVSLTVWRDGAELELRIPVRIQTALLPPHFFTAQFRGVPPYSVFGGCVFTVASLPYLTEWGREFPVQAPRNLVNMLLKEPRLSKREVVVLSEVLPHDINKGYDASALQHRVVVAIDGVDVEDFAHFQRLLDRVTSGDVPDEKLVTISLSDGGVNSAPYELVFPVRAALEGDLAIAPHYGIRSLEERAEPARCGGFVELERALRTVEDETS